MAFDPTFELGRLKVPGVGTQAHLQMIQIGFLAEANQLQQNRNELLDRLDDKLGVIAISLEQIDDKLGSR